MKQLKSQNRDFKNDQDIFFVQLAYDGSLNFANYSFESEFISPLAKHAYTFKDTISEVSIDKWKNEFSVLAENKENQILVSLTHKNNRQENVNIKWKFTCSRYNNLTIVEGFGNPGIIMPENGDLNNDEKAGMEVSKIIEPDELEKLIDSSLDVICCFDRKGRFLKVSAACYTVWGYHAHELIGKHYQDFIHPDDIEKSREISALIMLGKETHNFEIRNFTKSGNIISLEWSSRWDETEKKFYSVARDTAEKQQNLAALKYSEEKYKLLFYNHPIPMWIYDAKTFRFIEVNESAIRNYGYSREEFLQMTLKDIRPENELERFDNLHVENMPVSPIHKGYWMHKKKNGENISVEITANLIMYEGREAKIVIAFDRTEQIKSEKELFVSNERFQLVSKATFEAIWDVDIVHNKIVWNEAFTKMFGYENLEIENRMQWWDDHLHPLDKERVVKKLNDHLKNGLAHWEDEYRYKCMDGSYKYIFDRGFIIFGENEQPVRIIGAMQDLTERKVHELLLKELNTSLEKRAAELATSNQELERFAYVASHDLQEPLRMVSSFLELLEKKYKDNLDQKALQYIHYAVDGAQRMKALIMDLLEYSRVNTRMEENTTIDTNEILNSVKLTFEELLNETGGKINANTLPHVLGNRTHLNQLFQNLVGNSLKYRSNIPPIINITSKEFDSFFEFCFADNSIGIEPRFFPKIFIIFQRLHNRSTYSGTGIGLAICKKIVEGHGGKIWVTSEPGVGSNFYFTLPKSFK